MKRPRLDQSIDRKRVYAGHCRRFANGHQPNFIGTRFTKGEETLALRYQDVPLGFEGNLCAFLPHSVCNSPAEKLPDRSKPFLIFFASASPSR